MNQNICNICGADYEYKNGRFRCAGCGAYKPEEISNEELTLLYVAHQKMRIGNFYGAELAYTDIVEKYPQNPYGYWGRVLSKHGIKYERDYDGSMIATCCAPTIESLNDDKDCKKAMKLADSDTRQYFECQVEYIEKVRELWVKKASKEKPYDIFICYKDSDKANNISRTQDSIDAQALYTHLVEKGYRVFFSRESLRDKVGEKYEPYIFGALSTARMMIVYGSSSEYITSTWLKNEWSRYQRMIREGTKKKNSLIVAYKDFSPSELPTSLSSIQCLDASSWNFFTDLDKAVASVVKPDVSNKVEKSSEQEKEKKKEKALEKEEKKKKRHKTLENVKGVSVGAAKLLGSGFRGLSSTIKSVFKDRKPEYIIFIITLLLSIPSGIFATVSYFNFEMLTMFKIFLIVEIVLAIATIILWMLEIDLGEEPFSIIIYSILMVVHVFLACIMMGAGRFKVDAIVKDNDGYVYEMVDGKYYLYSCGKETTDLVVSEVPRTIYGISSKGLKECDSVETLVIDVQRFTVRKKDFAGWQNLKQVTFATEECKIAKKAFKDCYNLKSATFDGGNYNVRGKRIFQNCAELKDVYFTNCKIKAKKLGVWKGTVDLIIHLDNVADARIRFDGAEKSTVILYPGTSIYTAYGTADVLVTKEGFDFDDVFEYSTGYPWANDFYIASTVTNIPDNMFGNENSCTVYYQGDENMWSQISIPRVDEFFGKNKNYPDRVTVRYNSGSKYWDSVATEEN